MKNTFLTIITAIIMLSCSSSGIKLQSAYNEGTDTNSSKVLIPSGALVNAVEVTESDGFFIVFPI